MRNPRIPYGRMARGMLVLLAGIVLAACGRPDDAPPRDSAPLLEADEFSVMTFNVGAYGYLDRTGDGQARDMKPDDEREAVLAIITEMRPDILALQEMGGPSVFEAFREDLSARGLAYISYELLQRDQSEQNLAVLSRYPIISSYHHLEDTFSIGDEQVPVKRGYLEVDISIHPTYQFRLLVAQLKSKAYHPLGHTEMRRNEARLLNNHVRRALSRQNRLNLLVVGDMSDHIRSAPLRTIMGSNQEYLSDLRPADAYGEIWTYYDEDAELYHRHDYMLASPYMLPEYVAEKSMVVRHKDSKRASPHRPLYAVFRARDIDPHDTPLLPSYEYDE